MPDDEVVDQTPVGERDSMRSRRAAIAALAGALLIAGVPTLAFGEADGTHEAKAYSATATSDDVAAQKAKDEDAKKGDQDTKKGNKDTKKGDDKKDADERKKQDDDKWASDRKDDWRNSKHDDRWDKDWDHNRDGHHRRHDWDTHRRYYRYGYYGPGYYDDCGYYGPYYYGYDDDDAGYRGYDGNHYSGSYYGRAACSYEYGGDRSHMLVDMSWDQVIPDAHAGGYPARDAYGTGNLDIDVAAGTICYRLAYDGIDRAIGA